LKGFPLEIFIESVAIDKEWLLGWRAIYNANELVLRLISKVQAELSLLIFEDFLDQVIVKVAFIRKGTCIETVKFKEEESFVRPNRQLIESSFVLIPYHSDDPWKVGPRTFDLQGSELFVLQVDNCEGLVSADVE